MAKPATLDGYSDQYTVDCERVLVTLLRGLLTRCLDTVSDTESPAWHLAAFAGLRWRIHTRCV